MATPRVFVSHSHQDNAYCRDFVAALRQGLGSAEAVWYDEHNLGWGALRQAIDQELRQREHFIAILSPTAIASDWVNTEIDAALALLRNGSMRTIQFVAAVPCEVPPTLERYKRIERPGGKGYPPGEAAARALAVITGISNTQSGQIAVQSAAPVSSLPPAVASQAQSPAVGVKYPTPLAAQATTSPVVPSKVQPAVGVMYGVLLGLVAAVIGTIKSVISALSWNLFLWPYIVLWALGILILASLCILVGFTPARKTGRVKTVFVAYGGFFPLLIAPSTITIIIEWVSGYSGGEWVIGLLRESVGNILAFAAVTLPIVLISGAVGRWLARRVK